MTATASPAAETESMQNYLWHAEGSFICKTEHELPITITQVWNSEEATKVAEEHNLAITKLTNQLADIVATSYVVIKSLQGDTRFKAEVQLLKDVIEQAKKMVVG